MVVDRERYDNFVASSPQGTLFCTTWWLDAVAPGIYRIPTVQKGENIQAAWPIVLKRSRVRDLSIFMPPLTPWLGVLYRPFSSKLANQLSEEKKLSAALIEQLPDFGVLNVRFHRNFAYWSPFYWRGFAQTTRYTYVLEDLSDLDAIWGGLRENVRREIRKARREGVVIECIEDIEEFWKIHTPTFERQGVEMPYSADLVRRIDEACKARAVRKIFAGRDKAGDIHAVAYIVWDNKSAYYLMGGRNPNKKNTGATSLVIWEAIQFASTVTNAFDFEGSMIETVERFFRALGARPCPYYSVSNVNSPLRLAYRAARDIARSIRNALRGHSVL